MKVLRIITLFIFLLAMSCEEGYIDDISSVDPGPDENAPEVTINFPNEGTQIRVVEDVTSVNIRFEVTDDIEITNIAVTLDGDGIASFSDFIDFRRFVEEFQYDNLTNGPHSLVVTATDISGKQTSDTVNFEKIEPYSPMDGEIFYMPFDSEIIDLVTITPGTGTSNIDFATGIKGQALSLNAAFQSYVIYDSIASVAEAESFTVSFWINPEFVDINNDGGIDGVLGMVNLSNVSRFWGNIDMFVENGSNPTDGADMRLHITNGTDDGGTSETWITNVNDVQDFFGQWSNHILVYDATNSEFRYYINGALATAADASWEGPMSFVDSGPMVFGCVQFQTDPSLTSATDSQPWASYLTGLLDEVRVFNIPLSEQEVTDLYNAEKP